MKRNVIDNSTFPIRKVTRVRDAKNPGPAELKYIATLECGHEVGVKNTVVPANIPCYECDKAAKR